MEGQLIDPMWFYWLQIVDSVGKVLLTLFIVSLTLTFIEKIKLFKNENEYRHTINFPLVITIVLLMVYQFVPTKDTLIKMKISENVTYQNIDNVKENIKEVVDYIIEKTKE